MNDKLIVALNYTMLQIIDKNFTWDEKRIFIEELLKQAQEQVPQPKVLIKPFTHVNILTTVRMFRMANTSLEVALQEVYRYCDTGDIIKIECY